MPYSDLNKQREYQKVWIRNRRLEFFEGKFCDVCGKSENLQLHHKDPSKKVNHRIWSWKECKRNAEIEKCVSRCRKCHQDEHAKEKIKHGKTRYKKGCRCEICALTMKLFRLSRKKISKEVNKNDRMD